VPLWCPLVYILTLGSFAPFVLLFVALRHTPATAVGIAASSEVSFAFTVAWVRLGERLSLLHVAGSIVVFAGIVLAQTSRICRGSTGAAGRRGSPAAGHFEAVPSGRAPHPTTWRARMST